MASEVKNERINIFDKKRKRRPQESGDRVNW